MVDFNEKLLDEAIEHLQYTSSLNDFYSKYYIKRETLLTKIDDEIKNATKKAGQLKVLFSGYKGTGKTTELTYLKQSLEQNDFYILLLSLEQLRFSEWSDMYFTPIILSIISKLIELEIPDDKIVELHGILKQFSAKFSVVKSPDYDKVKSQKEKVTELLQSFMNKGIVGVDRVNVNDFNKKLLYLLDVMVPLLNRKVFFFIEDLKSLIPTDEQIHKFLLNLSKDVQQLPFSILVVVPHSARYSDDYYSFGTWFKPSFFLPILMVYNRNWSQNKDEINLMKEMVRVRVKDDVIENWIVEQSALYSGGIISKFLEILTNCCLKAKDRKKPVDRAIFNQVILAYAENYDSLTEPKYFHKLKEISHDIQKNYDIQKDLLQIKADPDLKELVCRASILEYKDDNGVTWFGIDPIIAKWSKYLTNTRGPQE